MVPLVSFPEVSEYLVGSAAFKAVGMGDPHPAGSIPVHLRQYSVERRSWNDARARPTRLLGVIAAQGDFLRYGDRVRILNNG